MSRILQSLFCSAFVVGVMGCGGKFEMSDPNSDLVGPKGDRIGKISDVPNWFTKDFQKDGVMGTSSDLVYSLPYFRQEVGPVVVAVLDSGVDTAHEDLAEKIWINETERKGKPGVDDDKNGYVDDIRGWNYLGGFDSSGAPTFIGAESFEVTRETARMRELKKTRESEGKKLTDEEQTYFDKVSKEVTTNLASGQKDLNKAREVEAKARELIAGILSLAGKGDSELTFLTIADAQTENETESASKKTLIELMAKNKLDQKVGESGLPRLLARIKYFEDLTTIYFNVDFNSRAIIIGDDTSDFTDNQYGNPVVQGPKDKDGIFSEADHGTHVAGIIGAARGNGKGIDGIARDVQIMAVRVVPNGDEYDKDIANAVRYAADNGAKIINMSFGKAFSPYKAAVDEAFHYAISKGVLIVHAAGNDAKNNDVEPSFPNRFLFTSPVASLITWLDVGASSGFFGEGLPATFSNYGKVSVDLFSPGVDILSTVPGNQYQSFSGTSMASPVVAGVAALVWSQFPTLTVEEVRAILLQSVRNSPGLAVLKPGEKDKKVPFQTLSRTGGVVNAYRAMVLACEYTGGANCQ